MPEIRELLHDAAPTPRPYDEGDVRARVATRRRHRRLLQSGVFAVVLLALVGGALALDQPDEPEQTVVAQPGPAAGKQAGVTAVAFVQEALWLGAETGHIGYDGEAERFRLPGPVRQLQTGDVLWAAGEDWVAATDPGALRRLGTWESDGGRIADIQPLEDEHVAISLPDDDSIAIVRVAAEGLEEIERIPVGADPTNLVLTLGNDLWVNDGDVICRVDWTAGVAVDEHEWSGALLAPSRSMGIWAVDGDRVIDLHPDLLTEGQSVAIGARHDFPGATQAVVAGERLYVGGPSGIMQFAMNDQVGMPVTTEVPVAMAVEDDHLAYVTGGAVHRFEAEQEQAQPAESEATLTDMIQARETAAAFLRDVLGWDDAVIDDALAPPAGTDRYAVLAHSPALGSEIGVAVRDGVVTSFDTRTGERYDEGYSISLGQGGGDYVYFPEGEAPAGLTPELTVAYGDHVSVFGDELRTDASTWEGDLGFVSDTPGWVQVAFRNADGAVVFGFRAELPPGPYAVG